MRNQITSLTLLAFLTLLHVPASSLACERPLTLKGKGGLELPGMLSIPCGVENEDIDKVVILIHGSGPVDMNADLTASTRDKKENLLFKNVSSALMKEGFAVIRYDKRSHVWLTKIQKDPKVAQDPALADLPKKLYAYLISDVKQAIGWSKKNLPNAKIALLGHSQGSYIALQVAHNHPDVEGVALWGFYATSMGTLAYTQIIHRTLQRLKVLDTNLDEAWTAKELSRKHPNFDGIESVFGRAGITKAFPTIDRNGDKKLSVPEIKGFLLSSAIPLGLVGSLEKQEAPYPTAMDILRTATFKTAFFHGTWDNQTPIFHTWAAESILTEAVPKERLHFRYFPRLGHGLMALSADCPKSCEVRTLAPLFCSPLWTWSARH